MIRSPSKRQPAVDHEAGIIATINSDGATPTFALSLGICSRPLFSARSPVCRATGCPGVRLRDHFGAAGGRRGLLGPLDTRWARCRRLRGLRGLVVP